MVYDLWQWRPIVLLLCPGETDAHTSASLFTPRMRSNEKQEMMIITVSSFVQLQDWEMIYPVNTSKRLDREVIYSLIHPIWLEDSMGTVCSTWNVPESYRLEARGALPLLCVWMWRYSGSLVWTEKPGHLPSHCKGKDCFFQSDIVYDHARLFMSPLFTQAASLSGCW